MLRQERHKTPDTRSSAIRKLGARNTPWPPSATRRSVSALLVTRLPRTRTEKFSVVSLEPPLVAERIMGEAQTVVMGEVC